jgi:alkanesulfonate monooxygenase SsuD/methylene tetrahydromethanopterin reductase-like flavin-dependent oxidoreductase (luciferase family)
VDEVRDRSQFSFDLIARNRFLFGSGDDIIADIKQWSVRTGADYLAIRMRHPGGPPHDAVMEAIARFGDEVLKTLSPP